MGLLHIIIQTHSKYVLFMKLVCEGVVHSHGMIKAIWATTASGSPHKSRVLSSNPEILLWTCSSCFVENQEQPTKSLNRKRT